MIWHRIQSLVKLLHELLYFKRLISKYGNSLLPGRYYLFPSMRAIAVDQPATMEKANLYFGKRASGRLGKLVTQINRTKFYQNNKYSSLETYEAIYSANNYDKVREIKLFSFQRQQILTICTDEAACKKQLAEYKHLHKWFAMPPVTEQRRYDHAYNISMVSLLPRPADDAALKCIAQCICAYSKDNPGAVRKIPAKQLVCFSFGGDMDRLLSSLVAKISPKVLSAEIPMCLQHGDLSRDNLIYGTCAEETRFWWIDWEHADKRPFFYDYFFYILNTAVYFSDLEGLRAYLSGACDRHLGELFSQLGLEFDSSLRRDYYLFFAVVFLKERVCAQGYLHALNMYLDFLAKHL